jgi:hypothetical protein
MSDKHGRNLEELSRTKRSGMRPAGQPAVNGLRPAAKEPRLTGAESTNLPENAAHARCVERWLGGSSKELSPQGLLDLLDAALGVLWARTEETLGEVTLTAIMERVLSRVSEKSPSFSSLVIEPSGGIQLGALREQVTSVDRGQLLGGIRFVLVEFLTVLGNLTAELLTKELHAELSAVALPKAATAERLVRVADEPSPSRGEAAPRPARNNRERRPH